MSRWVIFVSTVVVVAILILCVVLGVLQEWSTLASTLAGIAAGALLTFLAAERYYVKNAKDLKQEANRIVEVNKLLFKLLDASGTIEVKEWDAKTELPKKWSVGKSLTLRYDTQANEPDDDS